MNPLACLNGRLAHVVSATIMACAIAGCAGPPSQIVSRPPESSRAVPTPTPDRQQRHADQIDRKAMTGPRQTVQEGRMTRYGAFQPLFFGDGL